MLPALHCTSIFSLCGTIFLLAAKHHPQLPISVSNYALQVCRFHPAPSLFIAGKLKTSPISQSPFMVVQGRMLSSYSLLGETSLGRLDLQHHSPLKAKRAQKGTVPCLFSLEPFMNLY